MLISKFFSGMLNTMAKVWQALELTVSRDTLSILRTHIFADKMTFFLS